MAFAFSERKGSLAERKIEWKALAVPLVGRDAFNGLSMVKRKVKEKMTDPAWRSSD